MDMTLLPRATGESPLVIALVDNITDQKYADEALRRTRTELEQLAGHLIQTQEEERHRISRELHDDIPQRLSLLAIEVDSLGQSLADAGCDKELEHVSLLKAQAEALTDDVHQLSHQLHSARLRHLGFWSAVEELASKVSKQHHIAVNVSTFGRDTMLSPDVALCLFRVTQEALNNAVRHGHADFVSIHLGIDSAMAMLQVSDTGVGFNVADCEGGIGLVSMRERLRMIGGEFAVESHPRLRHSR